MIGLSTNFNTAFSSNKTMSKIILTILFEIIIINGYSQYVFKDREPKDFFADIEQGPTPKWSPDGKRFALITNIRHKSKIAIVNGDSIEFISGAQNDFKWSHDGRSIIYTAKDEKKLLKVFKYNLDTKESLRISHNSDFCDFYPSIANGDSIITYYNYGIGDKIQIAQIYSANTKKGIVEKLIDDPLAEYLHPTWSPSGNLFLYWKDYEHKITIEIIEIKTGRKVISISCDVKCDFLDWSTDEKEILRRMRGQLLKIRLMDGLTTELGSSFKKIIKGKWSHQSDLITFDADGDIYIINSDGQEQRKICINGFDPSWHPSGKKIIFVKEVNGYPIYEADTLGGNLKLLYDDRNRKKSK
jgi:Tol biopolymer transport system component